MDITPLVSSSLRLVQSYGTGFFKVSGQGGLEIIRASILLCDTDCFPLSEDDEKSLFTVPFSEGNLPQSLIPLKGRIDTFLLGMGHEWTGVLPPSQRQILSRWGTELGFVIDVMDTASACRTYNVLASEGRRIAAALSL